MQASNGVVEWQVPPTSSSSTLHETHSSSDALSDRGAADAGAPAHAPPPGLHLEPGAALAGPSSAAGAAGGSGAAAASALQGAMRDSLEASARGQGAPSPAPVPGASAGVGGGREGGSLGAADEAGPSVSAAAAADVNEVAALMRRRLSMGQLAGASEVAGARAALCGAASGRPCCCAQCVAIRPGCSCQTLTWASPW